MICAADLARVGNCETSRTSVFCPQSQNAASFARSGDSTAQALNDPDFLGLGRVLTDENGRYRFWTISPGAYLARPDIGRWRPKHIHLSLSGGGSRLITQMYFPGEPNNKTDPMAILIGDAFERNLGKKYDTPDIDVDHGYRFDIVVGGRNATFFE